MTKRDIEFLEDELLRKDQALIVALAALTKLSQKGSITRVMREDACEKIKMALNERLF